MRTLPHTRARGGQEGALASPWVCRCFRPLGPACGALWEQLSSDSDGQSQVQLWKAVSQYVWTGRRTFLRTLFDGEILVLSASLGCARQRGHCLGRDLATAAPSAVCWLLRRSSS